MRTMTFFSLPTRLVRPMLLILLSFSLLAPQAFAADPNELLQQGLIEEEANKNLDAAATHYQSLVDQFDQQRAVAATAIFRLGEIHRKQGKRDQTIEQYQRILREFPRQETLADLSRQNLTALGIDVSPTELASSQIAPTAEEAEELRRVQSLAKNSPDLLSPNQRLREAAQNGFLSVANFLLQHGAEVDHTDEFGETPLFAAARSGHKAMAQLLIDHGADVDAVNLQGRTSLHFAAIKGRLEVARTLVENGASLNVEDRGDNSLEISGAPLHYATAYGHLDIVKLLIDSNLPDRSGRRPLHIAVEEALNVTNEQGQEQRLDIIRELLAQGARVNAGAPSPSSGSGKHLHVPRIVGWTPLHIVAASDAPYFQKLPVAKLLIANGADINALDGLGRTPLLIAKDQSALSRFLLEHGADHIAQQLDEAHLAQRARDNQLVNERTARMSHPLRRYGDYNHAARAMATLRVSDIDSRLEPIGESRSNSEYDLMVRPEDREAAADALVGTGIAEVGSYSDHRMSSRVLLAIKRNGTNVALAQRHHGNREHDYPIYVRPEDVEKTRALLERLFPDE